MTPKQNRETAEALLAALGDKAPPELREALAAPAASPAPRATAPAAPRAPTRPRTKTYHHHHRTPRPRPAPESAAPLAWFAALLVGGACALSLLNSCDAQRSTRAIMQNRR
jgi:hypothetical protein